MQISLIAIFKNKKGVSPLIATILLLAFAVALATVVFQLDFDSCNAVHVTISEIGSTPRVCFSPESGQVSAFFETGEATHVTAFKVIVHGSNEIFSRDAITADIPENNAGRISFDYDLQKYGDILKIEFFSKTENMAKECHIGQVTTLGTC